MFGRKAPQPPTAAQRLSRCVQQAAIEREAEKEELEVVQYMLRGLTNFLGECESNARMRGSAAANVFNLLGQANQGFTLGADRVIAMLPPASQRSLEAARMVLGLPESRTEVADEKADAKDETSSKSVSKQPSMKG